jgi:hypothetical protein
MRDLADAARRRDDARLREVMTRQESIFTRKEVDRAFAWAGYFGEDRKPHRERFLAPREVVGLRKTADGPVTAYTTRQVLAEERAAQRAARKLHNNKAFQLKPETVKAAAIKRTLSPEQVAALEHATGPEGLAIIVGEAGTGKSWTGAAIREAYQAEKYEIRGLAKTNKVVGNLRRDGFTAATIDSELKAVAENPAHWKSGKTVLLVDEFAQLSTCEVEALARIGAERGVKVIAVGHDKQTGSVERGGMFAVFRDEFGAAACRKSGASRRRISSARST